MAKKARTIKSKVLHRYFHNGSHLRSKSYLSGVKNGTDTQNANNHAMHTRCKTTAATRNAVFNTTELLETILLHLPQNSVITARGVNQHFLTVIETSHKLQRELFFEEKPVITVWEWTPEDMTMKENYVVKTKESGKEWTVPAKLNHVIFAEQLGFDRATLKDRIEQCEPIKFKEPLPNLARHDSIDGRMFLSQPPTKQVEVELYYWKKRFHTKGRFRECKLPHAITVEDKERGVTFGQLLRECRVALASDPSTVDCCIKLSPKTVLYMGGVVFPTEAEVSIVKRSRSDQSH